LEASASIEIAKHTLLSCGLILAIGTLAGLLAQKIRIPDVAVFLVTGIAIGPQALGFIDIRADSALNQMAIEGGYPQTGQATQYYAVTNTAEFEAVLRTLVTTANTCTLSIPPPPTSDGSTSRANISIRATTTTGAVTIPMDATNGWTYTDAGMTSLLLHGTACDQWKAKTITTVTIVFGCIIM